MTLRKRPWYVNDRLCNNYTNISSGDLRMLQILKVFRGILLNLTIAVLCIFTILQGADPTVIGTTGLVGLLVINGVELTDYLAAKQALEEGRHTEDE